MVDLGTESAVGRPGDTGQAANGYVDAQLGKESTDGLNGYLVSAGIHKATVGLSRLQWRILRAAFDSRGKERLQQGVAVYFHELLHELWSFPYAILNTEYVGCGRKNFDPEQIGRGKYRSAMASLSRAVRRLEQRGLLNVYSAERSHWAGVSLAR